MYVSRHAGFVVALLLTVPTALLGADWPQFRGPRRDGKSLEDNLLKVWPEGGPRLLWTADGLGEGYGSNWKSNAAGDWVCLDWNTGQTVYEQSWQGNKGPVIFANGMLYCYDEDTGHAALVKASREKFEPVGTFQVTRGDGKFWAHPSIADGRLYLRHGEFLMAYDIEAK